MLVSDMPLQRRGIKSKELHEKIYEDFMETISIWDWRRSRPWIPTGTRWRESSPVNGKETGDRMERVMIEAGTHRLEAVLRTGSNKETAVLCHPHPLYGGTMDVPLLLVLERVYREAGLGTLRFNFRGVGRSGGTYDEGAGESEDVLAVCRYLVDRGWSPVHLAGYSFGAWVA